MSVTQANPSIQDIEEILTTHVELTPEEELLAKKITPHLKVLLRPSVRTELEADYLRKQKIFEDSLTDNTQKAIAEMMAQWKKEQEPLNDVEIAELLGQKYLKFTVTVPMRKGPDKDFVLCELPQAIEARLLNILQKKLVPTLKDLVASDFKLDMDSSAISKLQSILEAFPAVLEIAADLVAICLDPFGEEQEKITSDWVRHHMSSNRILGVLIGQWEVNRYRDFILNGFRLSKNLR